MDPAKGAMEAGSALKLAKSGWIVTVGSLFLPVWLFAAQAHAQEHPAAENKAPASEKVEAADDVEVLDNVEVVGSGAGGQTDSGEGGASFPLRQIVGRNHAALVHLPIGLIMGVLLLELLALFFPKIPLGRSRLVLAIATGAGFLAAGLTGFLRAGEMFAANPAPELLFEHRNLMIAAASLFTLALVQRIVRKDDLRGACRWIQLGLLVVAALLVAAGGHHGGQLVYGENFLPY